MTQKSAPDSRKIIERIQAPSHSPFLFKNLSEKDLQDVIDQSSLRHCDENLVLIQQGDEAKYLYFILKGSAKTFRCSPDGHETTIRMLKTGETFMESVLFMEGMSPIAAQTLENSDILMIPKVLIKDMILKKSQFASNILEIIAQHYKNAIQQVDSISTKSPVQRVGYFLLKLRMDQVKQGDGLSDDITLPFTKSMIANYLNMTPETFSRALKKLQTQGVRVDHEHIILDNTFALCQFCDSDMGHFCHKYKTDECLIDY